jgi:hypothetical protein
MKAFLFLAVVSVSAFQPASAQLAPKLPCADDDKECVIEAARNHVVTRIDSWREALSQPVVDRIGPASPQLVEYINLDNILNGFPERPRGANLDADLLADAKGALAGLPAEVRKLLGKTFLGFYFVEGLGGTGYTDYALDSAGKPVAAYSVFDAAVLGPAKANAWATWKEGTPFDSGGRYKLVARIEADKEDNRRNAIQYIMLHELGHVLSVGTDLHPPWNISPKEVAENARYPFYELSWKLDREADKYRSIFDPDFPQRTSTVYYFGAKLAAEDMVPTYMNLRKTTFPTLYAATSPGDDFAESFVTYVHEVLMHRPWQITILRDGKALHSVNSCWSEARCASKRQILQRLLRSSSQ